jgi:hypothetical protein
MTSSTSAFEAKSEFGPFLFAIIGEERNGMQLSVVSAMARSDVDPWQEAAELSGLPRQVATERLTSLIAALPNGPLITLAPGAISRLIALLPSRTRSTIPHGEKASKDSAIHFWTIVIFVIYAATTVGAQRVAENHRPRTKPGNATAPVSDSVILSAQPRIPTK